MAGAVRVPRWESLGGDALAPLRDVGAGRDPASGDGASRRGSRLGLRSGARLRARVSGGALRDRPRRRGGLGVARAARRAGRGAVCAPAERSPPAARASRWPLTSLPVFRGMGSDPEAVDRDLVEEGEDAEPSFFGDPKRIAQTVIVVVALVAAIYILLPRLVGVQDALARLDDATPAWIVVAL